jgi:Saf4/Yju2 protein
MKCIACGEYIYKGRKFNARKETTSETYYKIPIYRFYIRCTRCSGEITFKTDPKNMDYAVEGGARRNFEVWREAKLSEETEEERLDRLEREEEERNAMKELETKTLDAKREMAVADALDEIRTRNARNETMDDSAVMEGLGLAKARAWDIERQKMEMEDEEAVKKAFDIENVKRVAQAEKEEQAAESSKAAEKATSEAAPTFKRTAKKKKDFSGLLGIKKKPSLV